MIFSYVHTYNQCKYQLLNHNNNKIYDFYNIIPTDLSIYMYFDCYLTINIHLTSNILSKFANLKQLQLYCNRQVTCISCKYLTKLNITHTRNITNINNLTNLKILHATCSNLYNINNCNKLKILSIYYNPNITKLENFQHLTLLNKTNCDQIKIINCPKLKQNGICSIFF